MKVITSHKCGDVLSVAIFSVEQNFNLHYIRRGPRICISRFELRSWTRTWGFYTLAGNFVAARILTNHPAKQTCFQRNDVICDFAKCQEARLWLFSHYSLVATKKEESK